MRNLLSHHVIVGRVTIFHSSEPSQAILVDVDLEGITRSHQDIDAKIELKAINQKWLCNKEMNTT